MARPKKNETFKDRLKKLMGKERPYTWCRKAGIEKGLFQYYWQKGKIPTYENLIKLQNYTGCSLDWLITGEGEPFLDKIEDMSATVKKLTRVVDEHISKLEEQIARLKKIKANMKKL